jgi:hypothetical protein
MMLKSNKRVDTTLGKKLLDTGGSPVAAARMDPARGYGENLLLIQQYINEGSEKVWEEIRLRTDAVYLTVRSALA